MNQSVLVLGQKIYYQDNYNIILIFLKVYGVSYFSVYKIFFKFGLTKNSKIKNMLNKNNIIFNISEFINFNGLKKIDICNIENFYLFINQKINSYKGQRQRVGLPVRGQRTISNAKRSRSLNFFNRIKLIIKQTNLKNKV